MTTKYRVAALDDLERGELLRVEADGIPICLARTDDGEVYAINDTCTHEASSLSEGELFRGSVQCPMHGSLFSVKDGSVTGMPAQVPVATYPTSVADGDIYVEV